LDPSIVVSGLSEFIAGDVLTLDFGQKRLVGTLVITTPFSGVVELGSGLVVGDLTASGINATFNNNLSVTGTVTIQAVSMNTWNQFGDANGITMTANGGSFNYVSGSIPQGFNVSGDTKTETIRISGNLANLLISIETASDIEFNSPAGNVTITATLSKLTLNANVAISFIEAGDVTTFELAPEVGFTVQEGSVPSALSNTSKVQITQTGQQFKTIQAAIDAAMDGATIEVSTGTFLEAIVIQNKSGLTIIGDSAMTSIIGPSESGTIGNFAVTINNSSYIDISNFTINGNAGLEGHSLEYGIYYVQSTSNVSNNNTFSGLHILNIDRMGIYVYPENTESTTLSNNHIQNIHGIVTGNTGGRGIWLHGTGIIDGNLIEQTRIAITHTSNVTTQGAQIEFTNNIMRDFVDSTTLGEFVFSTGINSWIKQNEIILISNNTIESTVTRQVGMYLNYFPSSAIIRDNIITLSGSYVIGIDALNNKNGGYLLDGNHISVGSGSTAISLSTLGTAELPMVLQKNVLTNLSPNQVVDSGLNVYEYNTFFFDQSGPREVGLLISGSNDTKRIKDTIGLAATFVSIVTTEGLENSITGFVIPAVIYTDNAQAQWVTSMTAEFTGKFDTFDIIASS
jgi:hypothetical protein